MNKGRGFQNGWWLACITVCVMWASGLPAIFSEKLNEQLAYMIFGELVLIIPIIIGFFMMKSERADEQIGEAVGLRGFPVWVLPFIILLPPTAQSFAGFIAMPIQAILALLLGTPDYTLLTSRNDFWQNFLLICVLAPVLEELLCRGVIMSLFKRYGTAKMLLWSSLLFAMLHLGGDGIISFFVLGLLLGVIRLTTGSVFASIIAHSASNLYSLLMLVMPEMNAAIGMLFVLVSAILFPLLLWFYLTRCTIGDWRNNIYDKSAKTGFSAGFIVMLAIFAVYNLTLFISRLIGGDIFYDISNMFY